jgi:hypothetical protein
MIMSKNNPRPERQKANGGEQIVTEPGIGHQPYFGPCGFWSRGLATHHPAAYSPDA